MNQAKRQRWTQGGVVVVPHSGGGYGLAQMLDSPEFAFFDRRFERPPSTVPTDLSKTQILFRLWVMTSAYSTGRWLKIGVVPVSADLRTDTRRYKSDPISGVIRVYYQGKEGSVLSPEEWEGLECAAVWDAVHVEDRLRDHYARVPNVWVESLRPQETP